MKKVHFLGIAGSGASAIASIAQAEGFEVTGCDKTPFNEFTKQFDQNLLYKGHSASHLKDIDILAVTPAVLSIYPENKELQQAKKQGIEILTWQQFMGKYLEEDKFVIAVAGTHGKSTTTAMIGKLLEDAGLDPTVELGAIVPEWGTNFRIGKPVQGRVEGYFVTEADEFNDNFLASHPNIIVLTTVEMDHPEYFKNFKAYQESFDKFLHQTKDLIIANLEDRGVRQVLEPYQKDKSKKNVPTIIDYSKSQINFPLTVAGEFNKSNATAVVQVGLAIGIKPEVIQQSLSSFKGISRRFEYVGDFKGAKVYTDFAHHPTEIKVTTDAARQKFPQNKLWVIFQPHMFSRTKYLFDDFVAVFKKLPAERIIIVDIYPSREKDTGLIKSEQLVGSISKSNVVYRSPEELKETLHQEVKPHDVIFFMGAGDIDKLARKITQ